MVGFKKSLLVLLIVLPVFLSAQTAELGGYAKFFAHPNLNHPYPFDRLGSRVQLRLTGSLGEQAAFYSALDFNYDAVHTSGAYDADRADGLSIYPVETYVDLFFKYLDLRLGQQFIFWGKADWVNPTDNINPWDYVNISAEIEDYRLPVTAAKANIYSDWVNLELVWLPRFQAHRIPLHLPQTMAGIPVEQLPVKMPENRLDNSQFGVKADFNSFNVDYSLSYFSGYDKNPTIRMAFDPVQGQFTRTIEYDRYQVFGADFITTFNQWAVKGEGAYYLTKDTDGRDIFLQNPHIKYVLGVDYLPTTDLTLNLQYIEDILLQFDETYEEQTRRQLGMPLSTMPQQHTRSLSGRVQYQLSDFTSLQLISVYNLKDDDYFVLPILNYGFADGINIYAGATVFGGPEQSTFGRSKDYSRAFMEVKYSF